MPTIIIPPRRRTIFLTEYQISDLPLLVERVSSRVYHFTSLENAYRILSSDTMYLQCSLSGTGADNWGGKPFYMSLTRNRNANMSYGANYGHRKGGCRIEFDGDLLNQRFKGLAIDYWGGNMGKQSYYTTRREWEANGRISPSHPSNEMEDRVVSNDSQIPRISKYITRVDIFALDEENLRLAQAIKQVATRLDGRCYIYNNLKDFNFQTDNIIDVGWVDSANMSIRKEDVSGLLIRPMASFFRLALGLTWNNVTPNLHKVADWLRAYGLETYMRYKLSDRIKGDIQYNSWSPPMERLYSLGNEMKEIERRGHSDAQRFLQMVSDYCRKMGYSSLREWGEALQQEAEAANDPGYDYRNHDASKVIDVYAYTRKDYQDGGYVRNASANPNRDSFWDLIQCEDFKSRMDFMDEIYRKREDHFDYSRNEYVGPQYSHNSKSDEKFYKYLQHLAKNNISVSAMLNILNKLNIPLDDDEVFGGMQIVRTQVSYWDAPESIRREWPFRLNR